MKVKLVNIWQQKAISTKVIPVQRCCKLIDLAPSRYYAIARQQALPAQVDAAQIALNAAFAASGKTYGSRRLMRVMRKQGFNIGRSRVRRLMKAAELVPVWKHKFIRTTDSKHTGRIAPNLLNQDFKISKMNTVWVADITYIRTQSGWLYLAAVMDLCSRKIVGWSLASHMRASLVCSALQIAIAARQPAAGLIVHTDQGSQYASDVYLTLLATHKVAASMSGRGNCYDNAVMERFFLNLKMERLWQTYYANHQEAIMDVNQYVVGFYNSTRLHSALGYVSPNQFELITIEKLRLEHVQQADAVKKGSLEVS
jgi:putative transposase